MRVAAKAALHVNALRALIPTLRAEFGAQAQLSRSLAPPFSAGDAVESKWLSRLYT